MSFQQFSWFDWLGAGPEVVTFTEVMWDELCKQILMKGATRMMSSDSVKRNILSDDAVFHVTTDIRYPNWLAHYAKVSELVGQDVFLNNKWWKNEKNTPVKLT